MPPAPAVACWRQSCKRGIASPSSRRCTAGSRTPPAQLRVGVRAEITATLAWARAALLLLAGSATMAPLGLPRADVDV
jgi:hypothetical protein